MHYAAFLEGFTTDQEKQLALLLFSGLCEYLHFKSKKAEFTFDKKILKILKEGKTFFYYNPNSRLLETAYPKKCQSAILTVSNNRFPPLCVDYFKKLKFSSFVKEAYMLSANGLLFAQTSRTHKINNKKTPILYDGIVTAEFGLKQILDKNYGLIFGHIHIDFSSYRGLIKLLPTCKQRGIKAIYLELSYDVYSSLFENFNKNKNPATINEIIEKKKKESANLYKDTKIHKEIIATARELLIAAKKTDINVYPCDVTSIDFIDQSTGQTDEENRLKIGDACIIRSVDWLQSKLSHPKFLMLVGLAHAKTIARELGVPSCFIGEKKQPQEYEKVCAELCTELDYIVHTSSMTLCPPASTHFWVFKSNRLDQKEDLLIKIIIDYWNKLTQEMPTTLSPIPAREIETARETYIEYVLEKLSAAKNTITTISDICTSSQQFIIERLTLAIYPKCTELVHPKNWFSLFHCRRPYGIRLAENETDAFTETHLNELATNKTTETLVKLHYA